MYWSMVEMGLTIVAACLPTLRPLFGEMLPADISRIFQSFLSLRSHSSEESLRAKKQKLRQDSGNSSNSSEMEFAEQKDHRVSTEVYSMNDVEAQRYELPGGIMVQNHVSHTSMAR
jgi:hypothetical protein